MLCWSDQSILLVDSFGLIPLAGPVVVWNQVRSPWQVCNKSNLIPNTGTCKTYCYPTISRPNEAKQLNARGIGFFSFFSKHRIKIWRTHKCCNHHGQMVLGDSRSVQPSENPVNPVACWRRSSRGCDRIRPSAPAAVHSRDLATRTWACGASTWSTGHFSTDDQWEISRIQQMEAR